MVGAQDRRIPRQIVKVVHDHSHEQIEHEKRRQEHKAHKIADRNIGAAFLVVRVLPHIRHSIQLGAELRREQLLLVRLQLTLNASQAAAHNLLPVLARRAPKQRLHGLREVLEVVVAVDGTGRVDLNVAKDLHADDGVQKEEDQNEQTHVRQGFD